MKQEQVNAFCRRQHEEGRTVAAIWMPGPELRELSAEAIGDGPAAVFPDGVVPAAGSAVGFVVSEYLNPASGAVMPLGLMPEGGKPMASVRVGEGANTFLVPVG